MFRITGQDKFTLFESIFAANMYEAFPLELNLELKVYCFNRPLRTKLLQNVTIST